MLLSNTVKDFERIREIDHINKIIDDLNIKIPKYFKQITNENKDSSDSLDMSDSIIWNIMINSKIEEYDKEASSYRSFFAEDNMDEYEEVDDAKTFKSALRNQCPIIRRTMMSRMEELQKWKEDFTYSKPQEVFDTLANFLEFVSEYPSLHPETEYESFYKFEDFEDVAKLTDDKAYFLSNVLGTGIMTTVAYHMNSQYFNRCVRRTLYGLYFLTKNTHKITPSRTSEFIMIDDTNPFKSCRGANSNFSMEHNYWYPYKLFMFYSKFVYDNIKNLLNEIGVYTDFKYRYVYVNLFMQEIIKINSEAVKSMMGGDQEY